MRELLDKEHRKAPNWRAAIVARALQLAERGDLDAMKWIADRTDGKVKDETHHEHGGEVTIRVVRDRVGPALADAPPLPAEDPG